MRIVTGNNEVFSHYPDEFMWTGNGPREITRTIAFPDGGFRRPPRVMAALSSIDSSNAANLRVSLAVTSISEDHFDVRVHSWANTKLASVAVAWTAFGED